MPKKFTLATACILTAGILVFYFLLPKETPIENTTFVQQTPGEFLFSNLIESIQLGEPFQEVGNPNFLLPPDIQEAQLQKFFRIKDLYVGTVLQPSTNILVSNAKSEESYFSGILIGSEKKKEWKKLLHILDIQSPDQSFPRNNPYYMWVQENTLFLSIVDQYGAGSGEGNMKVYKVAEDGSWTLHGCYYYHAPANPDPFAVTQNLDFYQKQSIENCQNLQIVSQVQ